MPDPWTHGLPPDTRAVGTGDPANDMNAVIDALIAMGVNTKPLSLLVPAYQYPTAGTMWAQLDAAAPAPVKYVVANVSSGPGTGPANTDYTAAITAARAAGATVLGYVDTGNGTGTPSLATIQANVGLWNSLYGITDIFFDQVAPDTGHVSFYTTAAGYVSGKKVFNHGVIPVQGYAALADILVVFEDYYTNWAAFTPASWLSSYPPGKFAALVHDCASQANAAKVIDQARADGIGNVFVTDGLQSSGNPWGALPAYWTAEAAQAKASFGSYQTAGISASGDMTGAASTWTAQQTFTGQAGTGAIITQDITVKPNAARSTSASMFLDNTTGQIWEFFSNAAGAFGVFDGANSKQPLAIDANTPTSMLHLTPSGTFIGGGGFLNINTAGQGIQVAEGSNAKQGLTGAMTAGSIVVSNTSVTANSRIFLTAQNTGGTPGALRVSARTPGTSFTITSSSGTDTSTVAYEIFEPG